MKDGPKGHGFGCGDGSCMVWHHRHFFVRFLRAVVWQSSLRSVSSCGGRHGPGFRLGLLGLFVLAFSFIGYD